MLSVMVPQNALAYFARQSATKKKKVLENWHLLFSLVTPETN
jgi:hypothetical protein